MNEQDYQNFIMRKAACRAVGAMVMTAYDDLEATLKPNQYISATEEELMSIITHAVWHLYKISDLAYDEISKGLKEAEVEL